MRYNLIFKSENKQMEMNSNSDFKVIDILGLEATSYTINTAGSETDGANVTYTKIEPREIIVKGDIDKNSNELDNRETLIRFFNPKSSGVFYVTRNDKERKIKYQVSDFNFPTNKMAEYIQFEITLQCIEEPYFEDAKNSGNSLTLITPQFTFPLGIVSPRKNNGL